MTPDPKWLAILKASGWQTSALSGAFAAVFALIHFGLLPPPGAAWTVAIAAAGIICGCLAGASMMSALARWLDIGHRLKVWAFQRGSRKSAERHIPFLTEQDRAIIGYLLQKNQKFFTCASDGGRATTLISCGFVAIAARPGQIFGSEDMPMAVPDPVWDVLMRHRDEFPPPEGDIEPWRVHWMARR